MKYLYYIIAILVLLSAATVYIIASSTSSEKEAAIIVNDKIITKNELDARLSSYPRYLGGEKDCVENIITRELLIQEAQREGIDKEESFRRSIQNFYEQSLVKLLMDKKFASLDIQISEEEFDRYISYAGKKLDITIFRFDDAKTIDESDLGEGERKTVYFEDLSGAMRERVACLGEGGITDPFRMGTDYVVARLDEVESSPHESQPVDRERIRSMLIEGKKEKLIDKWIADLREKASVQILSNAGK